MNFKMGVFLGVLALSVFFFVPSVLPPDSSLKRFFPGKELNLGLDLKGGIHVVLGVDIQRALDVDLDKYLNSLRERMDEKKIPFQSVTRASNERAILVQLRDRREQPALDALLREDFFGLLAPDGFEGGSQRLILDERHAQQLIRDSLEQAKEIIRNRVDEFGVAEPSIQLQGEDRIVVQLPGVQDPARAVELIGKTALLEFKMVDDSMSPTQVEALVEKFRSEAGFKNNFNRADLERLNKAMAKSIPAGTQVSFEREMDRKSREVTLRPYLLKSTTLLTGQALEDAFVSQDPQTQRPQVALRFSRPGAQAFEKITGENVGKSLAILLDGVVESAPYIKTKIEAASAGAVIEMGTGNRDQVLKEARDLALVLRSGALPAPVEVLENRSVGASLGEDSIAAGKEAALWGSLLIILFTVLYYRFSGMLAVVTLGVNVLMLMAFMALFQATLTLPGIAGIVLTIGMAVDANVIIFERIREELRSGKKVRAALDAGFSGAHTAIFDSNLTTVLAGIVLFNLGTGPIRGFAVTLMVGLAINYLCAVIFSKWIFDWYFDRREVKSFSI
jgi:preprotein translocase subunit SecD